MDSNTAILLGSLGASLASVAVAGIAAWSSIASRTVSESNRQVLRDVKTEVQAVKAVAETVQIHTNGMSDKLAALAEAKGHAEGIAVGEQREKDKQVT